MPVAIACVKPRVKKPFLFLKKKKVLLYDHTDSERGQEIIARLTNAQLTTLSNFSGCFISLAKLGITAWPPKPARASPIPPNQLPRDHSGERLVGEGWRREPVEIDEGSGEGRKPSMRRTMMRRREEIEERREGSERRRRGRRAVGTILSVKRVLATKGVHAGEKPVERTRRSQ